VTHCTEAEFEGLNDWNEVLLSDAIDTNHAAVSNDRVGWMDISKLSLKES